MKQMRASLFKARCLKIMDDIQATGEPVVITKRGAPVVKVVPMVSEGSATCSDSCPARPELSAISKPRLFLRCNGESIDRS